MLQPTVLSRSALPAKLSTATVKEYLRVFDTEHDSVIAVLIDAAVEFAQTYTRQIFRRTSYRWVTDVQPIILPRFPVISVDSLEYTDTAGDFVALSAEVLAEYELNVLTTPPQLVGDYLEPNLRISWTAGLATDDDWPADLILLIWQMVEENFAARRASPDSAQAVNFSRAFRLALEQYTTHHDAVK